MDVVPYHRQALDRRWRALLEILLSVVFVFLGMMVLGMVMFSVAGARKLTELDEASNLAITLGGLALLVPACKLAGRALGRQPGTLSSTAGRLRWSWLARCVLFALVIQLVLLGPAIALMIRGGSDKLAWGGWDHFVPLAATIVAVVPLQASGEEYLFRGTLVQAVGAWVKWPWVAIVVSAAAFCAIHMAPLQASVSLFGMGAIAAYLTIRTGGLEAAIAHHVIGNLGVLLIQAASGRSTSAVKINDHATWSGAVIQLALQLLYAAIVVRSYRRRSPS
jgi:membrane protease YdiL (CAAX protease family)